MVYEANTLKNSLESNWSLTGRLAKAGTNLSTTTPNPPEAYPIRFYGHAQDENDHYLKAIEVVKDTSKASEYKSEFFKRETDVFFITVKYEKHSSHIDAWDQWESDMEDIEEEIKRILDTVYDPFNGTGVFFSSDFVWKNQDMLNVDHPHLKRQLTITLTRIVSKNTGVFDTFQRGVLLDVSESQGAGLPGADYQYTEVFEVSAREGFPQKELQVTSHPDGKGFPLTYSLGFRGTITFATYIKSSDIGSSGHKINTFFKRNINNEVPEIVLLQTYTNEAGSTLTISSTIQVEEIQPSFPTSDLARLNVVAKILKPSSWSIS